MPSGRRRSSGSCRSWQAVPSLSWRLGRWGAKSIRQPRACWCAGELWFLHGCPGCRRSCVRWQREARPHGQRCTKRCITRLSVLVRCLGGGPPRAPVPLIRMYRRAGPLHRRAPVREPRALVLPCRIATAMLAICVAATLDDRVGPQPPYVMLECDGEKFQMGRESQVRHQVYCHHPVGAFHSVFSSLSSQSRSVGATPARRGSSWPCGSSGRRSFSIGRSAACAAAVALPFVHLF